MGWEENKEFNESKVQVEPDPPKPDSLLKKTWKYAVVGVVCFVIGFSIPTGYGKSYEKKYQAMINENHELKRDLKKQQPAVTVLVPIPVPTTDKKAAPVSAAPSTNSVEPSNEAAPSNGDITEKDYINNEYFDLVEMSTIKNSIGYTEIIHKVLAKKNATVSSTILAYSDDDNSVLGKSSDKIVLTEGQYNFFHYYFESDVSNSGYKITAQAKSDTFTAEERNAVEMVQYNQTGDNLYITFRQNVDKLDYFAKYKLLFYKGDQIVDFDDGYFSISAKNMKENGDTDVAEIWVYGIDYDRFEYIFEP